MAKTVVLARSAEISYEAILDYLFNNWNEKVVNDFIKRFEKVTQLIEDNIELYPISDQDKRIRRCIVTKHNTVFFRVEEDLIVIVAIFDTRQNPEKLRDADL